MRVTGLALWLLYLMTSTACSPAMLDRVAIDRVVRETLTQPDLSKACASGEALTHALAAGAPDRNPPLRALMFSESRRHGQGACWRQRIPPRFCV